MYFSPFSYYLLYHWGKIVDLIPHVFFFPKSIHLFFEAEGAPHRRMDWYNTVWDIPCTQTYTHYAHRQTHRSMTINPANLGQSLIKTHVVHYLSNRSLYINMAYNQSANIKLRTQNSLHTQSSFVAWCHKTFPIITRVSQKIYTERMVDL